VEGEAGPDHLGQADAIRDEGTGEAGGQAMTDCVSDGVTGDGGAGIVTKESARSVADTEALLTELVRAKGLKLFAVIDHGAEAKAAGLELRETKVLIFGSPEAGTPVMAAAPLAALDLPLKVLVWDDGGQTKISYTAPGTLADRYRLSDALAGRLAGIDALTDGAVAT